MRVLRVEDAILRVDYQRALILPGLDGEGWQRNFVPKKFRGIDSEWIPFFHGRKWSFRGIPSFMVYHSFWSPELNYTKFNTLYSNAM